MTAQTYTTVVRPASALSTEKKKEGKQAISAAGLTALAALTTGATVADVLDILSTEVAKGNVVTTNSIGLASSVAAS